VAIAVISGDEATAVLADALADPDSTVRRHAALALGTRGATTAVPTLVTMIVEGTNDVEASEILGALSLDPGAAELIMRALVDELAAHSRDSAVRIRLVQALAEMPVTVAQDVLRQLTHDDDRAVALTASALAGAPRRQAENKRRQKERFGSSDGSAAD
jgi:HEAT repeat protein